MRQYIHIIWLLVLPALAHASSADVLLLKQARAQIKVIAGELKQRVARDVSAKGAENALASCRLQVEGLTDRLTMHSGWEIRRTAFLVRNPDNQPDPWEREVLDLFAQRKAEGVDLTQYEFAKVVNLDGKRVFRYMKPILMQGFCTSCHGSNLSAEVRARIADKYPDDQAVGFKPGDLRGAFSLLKVLPGDPP